MSFTQVIRCTALLLLVVFLVLPLSGSAQSSTEPRILSINPLIVRAASIGVVLTVSGSGFSESSIIRLNGEALPTTFLNETTVSALLPDGLLLSPGILTVTVLNTNSPSLATSNPASLTVVSGNPPTVASIEPADGVQGTTVRVRITGRDLAGAAMSITGTGITLEFVSSSDTTASYDIRIVRDAEPGPRIVSIVTPFGQTAACGSARDRCTFTVRLAPPTLPVEPGTWTDAGRVPPLVPLGSAPVGSSMTLLRDGKVLVVGGTDPGRAALYDPVTNVWRLTGPLRVPRSRHAATLLPDGRVLVAGGDTGGTLGRSAEIYDPELDTWSTTGFMPLVFYGSAKLLPNGRVQLLAGNAGNGIIYDPATGNFSLNPLPGRSELAENPIVSLADGRVVIGGLGAIYTLDAVNGFRADYTPLQSRIGNPQSAVTRILGLMDGRILVRSRTRSWTGSAEGDSVTIYDPYLRLEVPLTLEMDLSSPAILISDGRVLFSDRIYDPVSGSMASARRGLTASSILLADGRVLSLDFRSDERALRAYVYTPARTVFETPVISSVSKTHQPATDSDTLALTIDGSNFTPISRAKLGNFSLTTLYLSPARIVAFLPKALWAERQPVTVLNFNSASAPADIGDDRPVLNLPPTISGMTQTVFDRETEATVMLSGTNLKDARTVHVQGYGVLAEVKPGATATSVPLVIRIADDAPPGPRSLTVVTAAGSFTASALLMIRNSRGSAVQSIDEIERGPVRQGYAFFTPDSGSAVPFLIATIAQVTHGVVLSQTNIQRVDRAETRQLTMPVVIDLARGRNAGLAVTTHQPVAFQITLKDQQGTIVNSSTLTLGQFHQTARFITDLFPIVTTSFSGTFEISGDAEFWVLPFQFDNGDFTVIPMSAWAMASSHTTIRGNLGGTGSYILPYFVLSGGWATKLTLINPSNAEARGRIDMFDQAGNPMAVRLNGTLSSTFRYSIPPSETFVFAARNQNGDSPF